MSRRASHPNKSIESALQYAEQNSWRVEPTRKGHAWARIYCPYNNQSCRCGEFCIASVWSTPKNPENHARQIRRIVDNCTAGQSGGEDDEKL